MQGFDGLRERDGPVLGDRGALFDLIQAGGMRRIGGQNRPGQKDRPGKAEQENGGEQSGDRHGSGSKRVPVNAG
jgi:hypothetical protein